MRLFLGLASTSARPNCFITGGTYMAKRPRSPFFNGPLGGGLLFVGAAQQHPVAFGLQHGVQIVEATQVVAQLGFADLHHQRGRIGCLVAVGLKLRRTRRGR